METRRITKALWRVEGENNRRITAYTSINHALAAMIKDFVSRCPTRRAPAECTSHAVIITDGEYVKTLVTRVLTPQDAIDIEQVYNPHKLSPLVVIRGTWADVLDLRCALAKTFSIYEQYGEWFDILHFFGAKSVSPEMDRIFNSVLRDSGISWDNISFCEARNLTGRRGRNIEQSAQPFKR